MIPPSERYRSALDAIDRFVNRAEWSRDEVMARSADVLHDLFGDGSWIGITVGPEKALVASAGLEATSSVGATSAPIALSGEARGELVVKSDRPDALGEEAVEFVGRAARILASRL